MFLKTENWGKKQLPNIPLVKKEDLVSIRIHVHVFTFTFSAFFFFFSCVFCFLRQILLFITFHNIVHGIHNHFIQKKNIKNESYDTIYTFKNYFATIFLVFSFQQNKLYPNVFTWPNFEFSIFNLYFSTHFTETRIDNFLASNDSNYSYAHVNVSMLLSTKQLTVLYNT